MQPYSREVVFDFHELYIMSVVSRVYHSFIKLIFYFNNHLWPMTQVSPTLFNRHCMYNTLSFSKAGFSHGAVNKIFLGVFTAWGFQLFGPFRLDGVFPLIMIFLGNRKEKNIEKCHPQKTKKRINYRICSNRHFFCFLAFLGFFP